MHFLESQFRAPEPRNIARKAVPIAAGLALTAAAAALLNWWLAKKLKIAIPRSVDLLPSMAFGSATSIGEQEGP